MTPEQKAQADKLMRGWIGLDLPEVNFFDAVDAHLAEGLVISDAEIENRKSILKSDAPGLDIDPRIVPPPYLLKLLTPEDWRKIEENEHPTLALWSKSRLEELRAHDARLELHAVQSAEEKSRDLMFLKQLPLLHGTTLQTLTHLLSTGKLISNRAIENSGGNAIDTGHTHLEDRMLGLDQYVFADFGRPHIFRTGSQQPEVTLLLSPDVLQTPGTFLTEKDVLDCPHLLDYVHGLSLPDDFYETAMLRIRTTPVNVSEDKVISPEAKPLTVEQFAQGANGGQWDSLTGPELSTWEIKTPEVAMSSIQRAIFRNPNQQQTFVQRFGSTVPSVVNPDLTGYPY